MSADAADPAPGDEATADTTGPDATTTTVDATPVSRLAIGDSVMLGAAGALSDLGFVVDAGESRAFVNGLDIVLTLQAQDRLGEIVVVHLGTNGPIDASDMTQMLDALADVPEVLLVTNDVDRDYTADNNGLIYDAVNSRDNVFLLDWQGLASTCPGDCLYDDGLHLRPEGQDYYARLIASVLGLG